MNEPRKSVITVNVGQVLLTIAVIILLGREFSWFPATALLIGYSIAIGLLFGLAAFMKWAARR